MDRPGVRYGIHQTVVDQVPNLGIILNFFFQYLKNDCPALSYRVFTKFRIDIWLRYIIRLTGQFYVLNNFIDNTFVIVLKAKIIPDWKSPTQVG